uniref:NADH dehydrogenase subunit 6 n=1 Tax=Vargula hilgendorfii TaxID=6674 RepID=A0A7R7GZ10_VARHI|nr:NADH dehydrogenase subunit 6 [Vargula hilgendorfii]BCO38805.1 NADH dehydrogenase subunit 6 [Vargula hilgendorfii]BCO38857.1 NADH dehydrogenase subunit 6 [Vargula hilgendorfii]
MLISSLLISTLFATFTQPLSMGLTLIAQTIITSYILFKLTKMSWYAYILVIVLVGGLLVTFIYVAVLMPSEPHARRSLWSLPVVLPTALLLVISSSKSFTNSMTWASPAIIYSKSSVIITIILITLLLLALIIVVNNTYSLKGPMRSY